MEQVGIEERKQRIIHHCVINLFNNECFV
jgi:hypothetical protein